MNNQSNGRDILVFSIALNGYQSLYRCHFDSHKRYAEKHNYHYVCIQKPKMTMLGMECAWLKIALIIQALLQGYRWVVFLDADTYVNSHTPPVTAVYTKDKYLYVAKGYSGRLNSGVLIVKNSPCVLQFFNQVLASAQMALPEEDDIGWGENGHLIYFSKQADFVHYLDQRWNNNARIDLNDYIRHYSYGPLHQYYKPPLQDKVFYLLTHYQLAMYKRFLRWTQKLCHQKELSFTFRLNLLQQQVIREYNCFQRYFHDLSSHH